MKRVINIEKRTNDYLVKVEYIDLSNEGILNELERVLFTLCKVFFILQINKNRVVVTYQAPRIQDIKSAFGDYDI